MCNCSWMVLKFYLLLGHHTKLTHTKFCNKICHIFRVMGKTTKLCIDVRNTCMSWRTTHVVHVLFCVLAGRCGDLNVCSHECTDLVTGGFVCDCDRGYSLHSDGFSCIEGNSLVVKFINFGYYEIMAMQISPKMKIHKYIHLQFHFAKYELIWHFICM